jgi:hypothetical protein
LEYESAKGPATGTIPGMLGEADKCPPNGIHLEVVLEVDNTAPSGGEPDGSRYVHADPQSGSADDDECTLAGTGATSRQSRVVAV